MKTCDVCKDEDLLTYVDGQMKNGHWANMCPECFELHGVGLGTGLGQCYVIQPDGNYVKVEG